MNLLFCFLLSVILHETIQFTSANYHLRGDNNNRPDSIATTDDNHHLSLKYFFSKLKPGDASAFVAQVVRQVPLDDSSGQNQKISRIKSKKDDDDESNVKRNRIFLRKFFHPSVKRAAIASKNNNNNNIVLSPIGMYLISTTAVTALAKKKEMLLSSSVWSNIASDNKESWNDQLAGINPMMLSSKFILAGPKWSDVVVPRNNSTTFHNFKIFDSLERMKEMKEFLEVDDLQELSGAVSDAAVHSLRFEVPSSWKTVFDAVQKVNFDGTVYNFMKGRVPAVPWYEDTSVQMVSIPFGSDSSDGNDDVTIDFILSKGSLDYVDLEKHSQWVRMSGVIASHSYIVIPKLKIESTNELQIVRDKSIVFLQKLGIEWNGCGIKTAHDNSTERTNMAHSLDQLSPSFIINRPFYFIVRAGSSWLFTGYVRDL